MNLDDKVEHESFGKVSISKVSGGFSLFNSDISGGGAISLTISTAYLSRSLHHNWIGDENEIVEVLLSPLQWAEAITTGMNTTGVPCTINRLNGKSLEEPPREDVKGLFRDEISESSKERMKDVLEAHSAIESIVNSKGSIKKGDLKKAFETLDKGLRHFESNLAYTEKCFSEQVDRTVLEAKQQVNHFVDAKIQELGLASLNELRDVTLVNYEEDEEE